MADTDTDAAREREALREYYSDGGAYLTSREGIMKLLAIVGCLAAGALALAGGGCARAAGLAAGGAAACAAMQLAAALLGAAPRAPHLWLYTDVVGSAVLGALLLLGGVLSVTSCELRGRVAYVHAPLAACNAALIVGAAVATYSAVTRRLDAARGPAREPRRAPPADVDV